MFFNEVLLQCEADAAAQLLRQWCSMCSCTPPAKESQLRAAARGSTILHFLNLFFIFSPVDKHLKNFGFLISARGGRRESRHFFLLP